MSEPDKCSPATISHSAAWCGVAWYGMEWYKLWYGMVLNGNASDKRLAMAMRGPDANEHHPSPYLTLAMTPAVDGV